MNPSTTYQDELTATVPEVLRHVGAATAIDAALEQAIAPDRPRRTALEWIEEIGEALAWSSDDLELLDSGRVEHMTADDLERLASELAFEDDREVSVAELRTALRWRAQASLIQLASHAARAAATIADEDAVEKLR